MAAFSSAFSACLLVLFVCFVFTAQSLTTLFRGGGTPEENSGFDVVFFVNGVQQTCDGEALFNRSDEITVSHNINSGELLLELSNAKFDENADCDGLRLENSAAANSGNVVTASGSTVTVYGAQSTGFSVTVRYSPTCTITQDPADPDGALGEGNDGAGVSGGSLEFNPLLLLGVMVAITLVVGVALAVIKSQNS